MLLPHEIAAQACQKWGLPEPNFIYKGTIYLFHVQEYMIRIIRPSHLTDATIGFETAVWIFKHKPAIAAEPIKMIEIDGWGIQLWRWREGIIAHQATAHETILAWRQEADKAPGWLLAKVPNWRGPLRSIPWYLEAMHGQVHEQVKAEYRRFEPLQARLVAVASPMLMHGDLHGGNILADDEGGFLIDWDLVCKGPVWGEWTKWGAENGIKAVRDPQLTEQDRKNLSQAIRMYRFAKVAWSIHAVYDDRIDEAQSQEIWREYCQRYQKTHLAQDELAF